MNKSSLLYHLPGFSHQVHPIWKSLSIFSIYQVFKDLSPSQTNSGTSWVAQLVKNPPAMQETWVWSLGWEDPLEEDMATHSSILAWRIPRTEEPGWLLSMWSQRIGHDWATKHRTAQTYSKNLKPRWALHLKVGTWLACISHFTATYHIPH